METKFYQGLTYNKGDFTEGTARVSSLVHHNQKSNKNLSSTDMQISITQV
jgi:hypothetical protein